MHRILSLFSKLLRHSAVLLAGLFVTLAIAAPVQAGLPPGNAIKDPEALLRLALPFDNDALRAVQIELEDVVSQARGRRWSGVKSDIAKASSQFRNKQDNILDSVVPAKREAAETIVETVISNFADLSVAADNQDLEQTKTLRKLVLDDIGLLEASMVEGFPFEVPEEYKDYPQLRGRATVEMQTSQGDLTIVLDGYNAPITAGNFVDLVKRKFYNGLPFTRAEESYIVQAGDPVGEAVGFVNPKTKKYRAIPLEIRTEEANEPLYGTTLEESGRYLEHPRLPFSAYGAMALAHGDDPNDGSSQFFFHLFESEMTPAGANFLDGRYAIFGYVTQGQEILREITQNDTIKSVKVTQGLENFVPGKV